MSKNSRRRKQKLKGKLDSSVRKWNRKRGNKRGGRRSSSVRAIVKKLCGSGGWREFNGHCYKIIAQPMSAPEARRACARLGAHLASIRSRLENAFVTMLTGQLNYATGHNDLEKGVWIGMTRKPRGTTYVTKWHDKSPPTFGFQAHNHPAPNKFPWRVGQPDNAHGTEWCVHIYPSYNNDGRTHHTFASQWNDFDCAQRMDASVCKKRNRLVINEYVEDEYDYEEEEYGDYYDYEDGDED